MGGYGRSGEWHFGAVNPWSIPGAAKGRFPYGSPESTSPRSPVEAESPISDEHKHHVTQVFHRFDAYNRGELGIEELLAMRRLLSSGAHVSEQDTMELHRQMDVDRDGRVGGADFQDFMEGWLRPIAREERQRVLETLLHEQPARALGETNPSPGAVKYHLEALEVLNIPAAAMSELKSYHAPPAAASDVMSLVLIMLGRQNYDWRHAKQALKSSHRFLTELREFTASGEAWGLHSERTFQVESHIEELRMKQAKIKSVAAAGLLKWLYVVTECNRHIHRKPSGQR